MKTYKSWELTPGFNKSAVNALTVVASHEHNPVSGGCQISCIVVGLHYLFFYLEFSLFVTCLYKPLFSYCAFSISTNNRKPFLMRLDYFRIASVASTRRRENNLHKEKNFVLTKA